MNIKRVFRTAAILALAVSAVSHVRADDPPAPTEVVFSSISVASYEKVKEVSDLIGIPLPPQLAPDAIENALPFIGAGKFQTDAPLAISFVYGKDLDPAQAGIIVLPLLPGGAPLSSIPNTTATPDPETVVAGNGTPFRRTKDYLLFGGTVPTTTKFDLAKLGKTYEPTKNAAGQTVSPLFRCDVDMKKMKDTDPAKFAEWFDKNMSEKAGDADEQRGADAAKNFFKNDVDKLDLDIDQIGADYSLSLRIAPMKGETAAVDRPGMPDDCVMRADVRITPEMIGALMDTAGGDDDAPAMKAMVQYLSAVGLGDTESFGLTADGTDFVLYDVSTHKRKVDLTAEVKPLVEKLNAEIDKHPTFGAKLDVAEYTTADGTTVERVTEAGTGTDPYKMLYIDSFAKGGVVFTTFSSSDHHIVEKLAGLKKEGKFDTVASGWIKPAESVKALSKLSTDFKSFADNQQLVDQLGDQPLQWHADDEGNGVRLTLVVPRDILKNVGKLAGLGN